MAKRTTKATTASEATAGLVTLTGFPALEGSEPTTLILGEFPGEESLLMGEYYANPCNRLRDIIADKYGLPKPISYPDLKKCLDAHHIALWDVYATKTVSGRKVSYTLNDVKIFLATHSIQKIIFNGREAEKVFRQMKISPLPRDRHYAPSTSGAYAMPYIDKLAAWQQVLP